MHGSLGHFKAIIQRRKERLEKAEGRFDKRKHLGKFSETNNKINYKKPTSIELRRMKTKIKDDLNKYRIKVNTLWFVTVLILSILFYFFIN